VLKQAFGKGRFSTLTGTADEGNFLKPIFLKKLVQITIHKTSKKSISMLSIMDQIPE
jgi:hypothetical protein